MLNTHFNGEADSKEPKKTGDVISSPPEYIKLKEDFLANLTHDLKSPVFSQIQALKILLNDKSSNFCGFQKEILNQLLASNIYMRDMIQNVLMKFKIQNTKIEIEKTPNNYKQTINDTLSNIGFMFSDKEQKVRIKYQTHTQIANYDNIEIQRVLNNILSNASKYGDSRSEIQIIVEKQDDYLRTNVINTGKPIPPDEIDNVFDIYLTSSKKHKTIGTGLGLHICKQIIEAHGGKISAQNIKDNDVVFTFLLPIK